jgi:endo-1,4-beta-xylanase
MNRCLWPAVLLAAAAAAQAPAPKKPTLDQYGPLNWVDPNRTEPEGTHYKTFRSRAINADVSYLIYLPPDYDSQPAKRYPVVYFLHGSGGTPRAGAALVGRLDKAIRTNRAAPMISVFVNGLAGDTMYCDTPDGKYPVETVIIKDLIPHIDASYRTMASREARAVDGFSMGGFGAAHFGFKYPELFGVVSIEAPALLGPGVKGLDAEVNWAKLFPTAMGGDMAYYEANNPFTLLVKNADAIRDRTLIRIATHQTNGQWQSGRCEELHRLMVEHMIPHEFYYEINVRTHNRALVMDSMGDSAFTFFSTALPQWQSRQGAGKPH